VQKRVAGQLCSAIAMAPMEPVITRLPKSAWTKCAIRKGSLAVRSIRDCEEKRVKKQKKIQRYRNDITKKKHGLLLSERTIESAAELGIEKHIYSEC